MKLRAACATASAPPFIPKPSWVGRSSFPNLTAILAHGILDTSLRNVLPIAIGVIELSFLLSPVKFFIVFVKGWCKSFYNDVKPIVTYIRTNMSETNFDLFIFSKWYSLVSPFSHISHIHTKWLSATLKYFLSRANMSRKISDVVKTYTFRSIRGFANISISRTLRTV